MTENEITMNEAEAESKAERDAENIAEMSYEDRVYAEVVALKFDEC